jgi:sigma-B regulation protein RsbU (phosphoserine phosphatase)
VLKLPSSTDAKAQLRRIIRPRTKLGKTTLWFGVLTGLLELLRLVTRSPRGSMLSGWTSFLSFIFIACGLLMLLRWTRQKLMWRLRNRLIVTYVFIGVIPMILLVMMFGLAAYLFAGQFATYIAIANLRSELQHLESANAALAFQFRRLDRLGRLNPQVAAEIAGASEESFLRRTVSVWIENKGFIIPAEQAGVTLTPLPVSDKVNGNFAGIVMDQDRLHLRAVRHVREGDRHLVVISDVPITSALLRKTAAQLGSITLLPPVPVEQDQTAAPSSAKPSSPPDSKGQAPASKSQTTTGPSESLGMQVDNDGKAHSQVYFGGNNAKDERQKVSAGSVPAAQGRFDMELLFGTLFPVVDWASGKSQSSGIAVSTRPSVLYGALFDSLGDQAGIYIDMLKGIAIFFAVIELVALFIGVRLTRTMTKSVAELYTATEHVNRGDLTRRISVRTRDQMAALEQSFNSMMQSLARLIAEQKEKQRLESELAIAHEVQALLFPLELPELSTLEVHGVCRPARTVSGDYYDFIPLRSDKMVLALGDISGKGISAALLMATVHAFVRAYSLEPELTLAGLALEAGASVHASPQLYYRDNLADTVLAPGTLMSTLNYQLFRSTPSEKYATMFLGCYDASSRSLTYANAGHLSPMLFGANGEVRRLEPSGTVVGLFDGMTYDERTVRMQPGDMLVGFSDGITEPENEFGEFGEDRLIELIQVNRDQPLARISDIVTSAITDWIGGGEQPDDVTLVLARSR